jgi:Tfp pilus assembly protein PilF
MERQEKLKEFIARDPSDYFSRHALAMEYIKTGNEQDAKELLEKILKDNPSYIGSYYHLGKLYERLGKNDLAEAVYEKGIEVAAKLNDRHAMGELNTALNLL